MQRPRNLGVALATATVGVTAFILLTLGCAGEPEATPESTLAPESEVQPARSGAEDTEGDAKAPGVFLPGLEPELEEEVGRLAEKMSPPAEPAVREEIGRQLEAFAQEGRFVEREGRRVSVVSVAYERLRAIGNPALPDLMRAVLNSEPKVRSRALNAIYQITQPQKAEGVYLPLFARSLWDKAPEVRTCALAQIGNLALAAAKAGNAASLEAAVAWLRRGLDDPDPRARYIAGEFLWRVGRKDLVPHELLEQGVGTEQVGG